MIRYVALLRGINVSGQKLIKMKTLSEMFESFGLRNIKTYIQSGNVIFETAIKEPDSLGKIIEKKLYKLLGYDVKIMLRTFKRIEELVELNIFEKYTTDNQVKYYISFLSGIPSAKINLPMESVKKDIRVVHLDNRDLYCLSYQLDNGSWGFPNAFIEKQFQMPATTRSWTTVNKISLMK